MVFRPAMAQRCSSARIHGNVDQVGFGNADAFPQDRSCNIGVVMVGQPPRQLLWNQAQVGKASG